MRAGTIPIVHEVRPSLASRSGDGEGRKRRKKGRVERISTEGREGNTHMHVLLLSALWILLKALCYRLHIAMAPLLFAFASLHRIWSGVDTVWLS